VSSLAKTLDLRRIVHIRGTPASGKSILSLLLRDYYLKNKSMAFRLSGWKINLNPDPWRNFACNLRRSYPEVKNDIAFFADNNVIIMDEAQSTYSDTRFWDDIVKQVQGLTTYNIKLCFLSSYGSPSTGLPYNPADHSAPVSFGPNQCISLTPTLELPIGLFYNADEFDEAVAKLCSREPVQKYAIDRAAQEYIFNFTGGHPGGVTSVVEYIFEVCNIPLMIFYEALVSRQLP
jgi:hypothetical protein